MTKGNLCRRLERLEARAWATRVSNQVKVVFVNGDTPGGLRSVRGTDGRHVWWNPPEGCKVGELLEGSDDAEGRSMRGGVPDEIRVVFIDAKEGGPADPTTVMGPNRQLVWLEPPEGYKEGQPIEDSAEDPETTE